MVQGPDEAYGSACGRAQSRFRPPADRWTPRSSDMKRPGGATISAPGPATNRLRSGDQNEYVPETRGNGAVPRPSFHTAATGSFQKPGASVASSMSEPSFTPAPMLNVNT